MNLNWRFFLEGRSFTVFYTFVFLLLFIAAITKLNLIIFNITLGLICLLFVFRVIHRRMNLNRLVYFNIDEKNYKQDSIKRGEQLGDLVAIILYIILCLDLNINMIGNFKNDTIIMIVFCALVYLPIASISISKNKKILKVITILLATFYGLFIMLFIIFIPLALFISYIGKVDFSEFQNLLSNFKAEDIVILSFILETNLLVTIVFIACSIILFLVFIFYTPPYQLDDLTDSLKIANLIVVIVSVIIFYYANVSWEKIVSVINDINNLEFDASLTSEEDFKFKKFVETFSKSNIINLGYILLLPYVLGITIANLVVDILKKRYKRKATSSLDSLLNSERSLNQNEIELLRKKFVYNGGEKYNLKLLTLIKNEDFKKHGIESTKDEELFS